MKKNLIIALFLLPLPLLSKVKTHDDQMECLSTREYITTLNFLRDQKDFKLKEEKAQSIAMKVSKGCSGAAKNFIKVTTLLLKVRIDSATAIKTGIKFSALDSKKADNFYNIFKRTYQKDMFDMSLQDSLNVSTKLSATFEGDVDLMFKDFKKLTSFCMKEEGLVNNKLKCADFAAKVSILSGTYNKNMSEPFIDLFKYLTNDSDGPKLSTYKAIELAHNSIKYGPKAFINFKHAFEYAKSEKGLKLQRDKSVAFALDMAKSSSMKRVPASKN